MHQCAQQKAEQQNVNVDTGQGGVEQSVHRAHQRVETRHGGVDDGARQNADEQRGNNLFRDESQYDGKDRRQQRQPTGIDYVHVNIPFYAFWRKSFHRFYYKRAPRGCNRLNSTKTRLLFRANRPKREIFFNYSMNPRSLQ